jgi:hypothetical protein
VHKHTCKLYVAAQKHDADVSRELAADADVKDDIGKDQ